MSFLRSAPVIVLALVACLVLAAAAAVSTLSVSGLSRSLSVTAETVQVDSNTEIEVLGTKKNGSSASGLGESCGDAREATTGIPTARTVIGSNYWIYKVEVRESSVNAWATGYYYKIEVFADGDLKGTLYVVNANDNSSSNVEGVTARLTLAVTGNNPVLPDTYTTVVTALGASCS